MQRSKYRQLSEREHQKIHRKIGSSMEETNTPQMLLTKMFVYSVPV